MDSSKKRKFLTRLVTGLIISAIVIPAYFIKGGIYFYYVIQFAIIMSIFEFVTILCGSRFFPMHPVDYTVTSLVFIELLVCIMGVRRLPIELLGGLAFVCVMTDAFAYLLGNFYGGLIFKKKRPFPISSPNKTYEGLIGGMICGVVGAYIWTVFMKNANTPVPFYRLAIAVPISVLGDLLESRFKRLYDVKDANDFMIEIPGIRWLEAPLGGRDGHGGYLDRTDSLTLVIMLELLIP